MANISFGTKFNLRLTPKQFIFNDSSDYAGQSIPTTDVNGCFKITSPSGIVIYNNTDYSDGGCDILIDTALTNQTTISLPLGTDSLPQPGVYTIIYTVYNSVALTYYTITNTYTYVYVRPSVEIIQTVDCISPLFTSVDATNYAVSGITPANTRVHTIDYPYGSAGGSTPVVGSAATVTTGTFYNGTQTTEISSTLTYVFSDGLQVLDIITGDKEILVNCVFICSIYCCIRSIEQQMLEVKGVDENKYQKFVALFNQIMSFVGLAIIATDCGKSNDVNGYLDQIRTLSNCTSDCDCSSGTPSLVTGIGGLVNSVIVNSGGTPVVVTPVTVGNTTTYTITLDPSFVNTVNTSKVRIFANTAARTAATPDFDGQLGIQLDTDTVYEAIGLSAGDWAQVNFFKAGAGSNSLMSKSGTATIGSSAIGIGVNSSSAGANSVALGTSAFSVASASVAIGSASAATAASTTAVGESAAASSSNATAIGKSSIASGNTSVALGSSTLASGVTSIAIGSSDTASANDSTAIGNTASATAVSSIAFGKSSSASGVQSISIGDTSSASAVAAIAIGHHPLASGIQSIAIGDATLASGLNSVSLGKNSAASATNAVSIGNNSEADSIDTVAIGNTAQAVSNYTIAIGQSGATGLYSIAIGKGSSTNGDGGVALGTAAVSSSTSSTSIGQSSTAYDVNSTAIGAFANAVLPKTTNIAGTIITRKDRTEADYQLYFSSAVATISTAEVSLKSVADYTITLPTGSMFFPDSVDLVITNANTVTGQPTVRAGGDVSTASLLAAVATTSMTTTFNRQRFNTLLTATGQQILTAGVTVGATGTTLKGRFIFTGKLIESQ